MKNAFILLLRSFILILFFNQLLIAKSNPSFVNTIDLGDTIFIDVENAIVGAGFIDYPVYINSDDPIQSMDFQFFFNTAEFTYDTVFNNASLSSLLVNVAPEFNQGGALELRLTSFTFPGLYPNQTTLVTLRFTTNSIFPCNLNIVTNQNSVIQLGDNAFNAGPCSFKVLGCSNPPAFAGEDQNLCSDQTTLTGNQPLQGAGTWSVVSGNGDFQDPNGTTTAVTGLLPGFNSFKWTLNNNPGDPENSDTVLVFRYEVPSQAVAGQNQTVCDALGGLNAAVPSIGSGIWSAPGSSLSFADETSNETLVFGLVQGENQVVWTVSNGVCPPSSDTLIILRTDTVYAGADQAFCETSTFLEAATPIAGSGTWTVVSGTAQFEDANNPNTLVSGLSPGENILQWSVTGLDCIDSTDQVSIFNICNTPPVITNNSYTLTEDDTLSDNFLLNGDIDPDGTVLSALQNPLSGPLHGTIEYDSTGSFTYIPDANYFGLDTIVIQVCDSGFPLPVLCGFDTLFIEILPVNDAPNVNPETFTTQGNTAVIGNILDNDSDIEGTTLTADTNVVNLPNNGTFTIDTLGNFTYTPNDGFTGIDTVVVLVCDSGFPLPEECAFDTLIFIVNPVVFTVFAGDDTELCETFYTLQGSELPEGATGVWTILNGDGTFADSSLANTAVTEMPVGTNSFIWTVTLSGTSISDTVNVVVSEPPTPALAGDDQNICGNRVTLAANTPVVGNGSWSLFSGSGEFVDANDPLTTISGLGFGSNVLVWTIATDICRSSDTLVINAVEVPFIDLPNDTVICENEQPLNLSISYSTNAQLQWNVLSGAALISGDQTNNPKLSGLPRGLTQIEVVATNGDCESRDTLNITVSSADSPECRNNEIVVPKGYSPNGDGTADFFVIENLNGRNAQLQIFNRWGQMVYESDAYQNDWNGTANKGIVLFGEQLPEGTYYYLLNIEGEVETRKDFITLWR
ncbi:MAG: Ig-like domain-containing protein [Bacteroidia bacterium]|jgi:gliding motility-associated-like protein